MDEYKIDEYFLYNSFKNDGENFKQLINRFFGHQAQNIIQDIQKVSSNKMVNTNGVLSSKLTNDDFYKIYAKYVKLPDENEKRQLFSKPNGRQIKFANAVDRLFHDAKMEKPSEIIYLDYGCNDGMFTQAIAKHFNIPNKNVWAVDIVQEPYIIKTAGFNYVRLDLNDIEGSLSKLPNCNFITIINVIHHIPAQSREPLLKILNKKISPGAKIIIKEHDCLDNETNHKYAMYIAEWHKLYKVLYKESDSMGELYLMNVDQLSAYMMLLHANLKTKFYERESDILKAYCALYAKE